MVRTGIAIADEDGLEAVTMQRLAERLGTTKMALYRYVPGRAELDALMFDSAFDLPPSADGRDWDGRDWRGALTRWAQALFAQALAHPWAVDLARRGHVPGPRELAWFETGLRAMDGLGLTSAQKLDALAILSGHVMSLARRSPTAETELAGALGPLLATRAGDYPLTAAAFSDTTAPGRDDGLRFGIHLVLDGIQAIAGGRPAVQAAGGRGARRAARPA
ncbi:MAG: TetR/AcrR family transcriptional regulator [Microbacteriaceae bacterium]